MNDRPPSEANEPGFRGRARAERTGLPAEAMRDPRPTVYQRDAAAYAPDEGDEKPFDIYKYLRIVTKYRWLIASITLAALALTAVSTLMLTPIYRATASIQIEREAANIVDKGQVVAEDSSGFEFYQTQYLLLSSRTLAERVAAALALGDDTAFNVQVSPTLFNYVKGLLLGLIIPSPPPGDQDEAARSASSADRNAAAAGQLLGGLSIEPVRDSRIVRVSFSHPDPAVAMRVANGYAEVFIKDNLDRRFEATSYARRFLEERLGQLKAKLEESERLLVQYADEKGILSIGGKAVADSDVEAINTKLTESRHERIRLELMWQRVKDAEGLEIAEIRNNVTVQENRKIRSELSAQYQQKLNIFKPSYPEMQQLRSQIEELDAQLADAVRAVKSDIKSSYEAAKTTVAMLEAEMEKSKSALVQQRNRSIQYNILQREVDTNRQLYDGLLQRYKEIGVAGGVGTNNISFVDKATMPGGPASPNVTKNLLIGLLAGLALGFMLAFALDFLDETLKVPEDIEREVGLPVIGIVPLPLNGVSFESALLDQRSPISEAYRSLRTSLQFSTPKGLPSSILVTSSMPSEGKSTTAIGIADVLGKIGLKVLLIDADLRKPSLHFKLGLRNERGLTNYLIGRHEAAETLQVTPLQNVFAMTSGPIPPNPAELLAGLRMADLVAAAGEAYDVVIVDGPPVIGLADAPLLSGATQVTLLVVSANSTRRSTLRSAVKRLQGVRANVIGSILNKFDRREAGYGYSYGDHEYYGYGQQRLPSRGA